MKLEKQLRTKLIELYSLQKANPLKTGIKVFLVGEKVVNVTSPYD